ncbi:hypothetical protein C8R44DRAFT_852556 [Mycena epipterygia]|nr:hypothetical protein C8R44DRAFT_852556 [Mycena epipterygia]
MSDFPASGYYIHLVQDSLIPLQVVLVGLTWIIHDYFFDAIQIHVFATPGITSDHLYVGLCSRRCHAKFTIEIAVINALLFAGSIAGFMWILVYNHSKRADVIATAIHLPLPGCPTVHSGIEWSQWVPATIYEGILFGFALFKTCRSAAELFRKNSGLTLYRLLLRDNLIYFFGIAALLVFNNLMVVSLTHIPWFSYGPFHACVGIMTTRMLINLRKATAVDVVATAAHDTSLRMESNESYPKSMATMSFGHGKPEASVAYTYDTQTEAEADSIIQFSLPERQRGGSPSWPVPEA